MTWLPWVAGAAASSAMITIIGLPFWILARQDARMPLPADWTSRELAAIALRMRAAKCCTHRHCAGCAEPARTTTIGARHLRGRHTLDAMPHELRYVLGLATVTERAREIARQLDPLRYRVWSNPAAWRARAGRPLWLSRGTAIGGTA